MGISSMGIGSEHKLNGISSMALSLKKKLPRADNKLIITDT